MKRIYLLATYILLAIGLHATTLSVRLDKAGTLKEQLPADYLGITTLKIAGHLNGEDMRLLREMAGLHADDDEVKEARLDHLDLQEAFIDQDEIHSFANLGQYTKKANTLATNILSGTRLKSIILPESLIGIESNALARNTKLEKVVLGEKLKSIGEEAFTGCSALADINLPKHLTRLDKGAFADCTSLTSVEIGTRLRTISDEAFTHCSKLAQVIILANEARTPQQIGHRTFSNCTSLKTVVLPATVQMIGDEAFANCPLTDLRVAADIPPMISPTTFQNLDYTKCKLSVDKDAEEAYRTHNDWRAFNHISTAINGVRRQAETQEKAVYTLSGNRASGTKRGIYIVKMADGRSRKQIYK